MKRRRTVLLIAVSAAITLFAFWIWDTTTPIPLIEINWVAPKTIEEAASYDTDGDGCEDALVVKADQWWQLRIVDGQWQAEPLPVPSNYDLVGLTFLNSPILLFIDPQDLIWVMQYCNRWVLRPSKVKVSRLHGNYSLYDLDGDGQKDDLVVNESKNGQWFKSQWFKLETDGSLVLKDELSLPPNTTPLDIYAWQGKLQVIKGSGEIMKIPDVDGDSVMEQMVILGSGTSYGEMELELVTSRKSKTQRLKVPFRWVVLDTLMPERSVKAMDINNDGWQEIILVGERNQRTFLFLLHYDGANWRSEIVPIRLVIDYPDDHPDIFTMQVGRSKRLVLFSARKNELQMLWHDGRKWREQRWRFKGHPTLIWEERGTWRMLIARCVKLDRYLFWQVFRKWCLKLRNWKLPVLIPPNKIYSAEVWEWDEKGFNWRREGSFALGSHPSFYIGDSEALNLNRDGYEKVLVAIGPYRTYATLATKVGRWRKRWKSVHLWDDPYPHSIFELNDGKRIWLVSVKGSNLQAWTLK